MKIDAEQDGFNRTLKYYYNPNEEEHTKHYVYFYTNPNSPRIPTNKGEIGITCKYDNETVYIGRGSKEQYLKLCEIINEINSNEIN